VKCPGCGSLDDKVVDSRQSDDGGSIRRRRQCLECARRYTTFERLEELPLLVVKRSGEREPFDLENVVSGVRAAAKYRPISDEQMAQLACQIEDTMLLSGPEVSSEAVGLAVLECLRDLDSVAYLRFASVYKGFDDPADFEREVAVLTKESAPKRR
jgi:transcriptional repressor NrdR